MIFPNEYMKEKEEKPKHCYCFYPSIKHQIYSEADRAPKEVVCVNSLFPKQQIYGRGVRLKDR